MEGWEGEHCDKGGVNGIIMLKLYDWVLSYHAQPPAIHLAKMEAIVQQQISVFALLVGQGVHVNKVAK